MLSIFEVQVTETNVGFVFVEADSAGAAAELAESRLGGSSDWGAEVDWDVVGMSFDEGIERSAEEVGGREVFLGAEPEVEPEVVTRWASKVVQDAAWLAARAAEVWPVAVGAEGRLAAAGGELTPRGAAVRSALRTALALEAEGATVRAARQLWRALDAARA